MRTFENTTIKTNEISKIRHRSECDTTTSVCGVLLDIPLIASPMPDVCGKRLARAIAEAGGMALIHRFQSIAEQVQEYKDSIEGLPVQAKARVGCAIGAVDDFYDRVAALVEAGCSVFCIDTANGANVYVAQAIYTLRTDYGRMISIIAGNVASAAGFKLLDDAGADAIRVGIAGGSVCETKTETGIFTPTLEAVYECQYAGRKAQIIADGGIRIPGDMNKCLSAGARAVMVGSVLVATKESPAKVIKTDDGKFFKIYRGAASYSVQQDMGKDPYYNEGAETLVPFDRKMTVADVVDRYKAGLQSSMSYANALNLSEYPNNTKVTQL